MEASDTKLKKQEGIIDILMEEVKRLKAELVKYRLIKELVNNESENFLIERQETNQGTQGKAKTSQCQVCGLKTHKLFERNRGKSSSYLCCADCYENIEKDTKRVKYGEKEALGKKPIIKKIKRTRKGISNEEALKHSKPSKNKNKTICKDCGGEYLTSHFHSHYASHIK